MAKQSTSSNSGINVRDIGSHFQMQYEDVVYDPILITTVSINSVEIEFHQAASLGATVQLGLIAGDWELKVHGTVVACSIDMQEPDPQAAKSYCVRIQFDPANTHNNVLFFMAVRTLIESTVTETVKKAGQ